MKNFHLSPSMQADISIRQSTMGDVDGIVALYQAAGEAGGGLARAPDEVSRDYVSAFIDKALNGGVSSAKFMQVLRVHGHSRMCLGTSLSQFIHRLREKESDAGYLQPYYRSLGRRCLMFSEWSSSLRNRTSEHCLCTNRWDLSAKAG